MFDISLPDKITVTNEEVGGVTMGVYPYVGLTSLFQTKILLLMKEVGGVTMGADLDVCV